jgi:RNA polymerase sigma factor (TIGR02999 family)
MAAMERPDRSAPEGDSTGELRSGDTAPVLHPKGLDERVAAHYDSLRELARQTVRGKKGQRILDPTELVHESYMRLSKSSVATPLRRTEFLALAATVIRNVLVDHARELQTLKRGGQLQRLTLDGRLLSAPEEVDLLALDEALVKLARLDQHQARVVELKFFGGMTIDEIAKVLAVSARTIDTDWALARAWLRRELSG